MLESSEWTSAGRVDNVSNKLKTAGVPENPDLEDEVKKLLEDNGKTTKQSGTGKFVDDDYVKAREKKINSLTKKVEFFDKGNMADIQSMTSAQFGNVRSLATNPVQFMMGTVFKKLAKGAGVIGLALIIMEAVKFIINESLKPGRFLDRRFKRDIENEIFAFRSREEKQKLRQGFNNIIVTSIGGLRGGAGQITSSRGLLATGQIDRVINTSFSQPGTSSIATGTDLKGRVGKPGSVF
jgi:hypothetical protein